MSEAALDGATHAPRNQTTDGAARDDVEYLSIIIWCVGGLLLILLLFFILRISLAKKEPRYQGLQNADTIRHPSSIFQIHLGTPGQVSDQSSDTSLLLHSPGRSHQRIGQPRLQLQDVARFRNDAQIGRVRMASVYNPSSSENRRVETSGNERCRETQTDGSTCSCTSSSRSSFTTLHNHVANGQLFADDESGCHANVNGYTIMPPSYHDVVSTRSRELPAIVVSTRQPRCSVFFL